MDGHDVPELLCVLQGIVADETQSCQAVVIARTVKGKGVSFMANELGWQLTCAAARRAALGARSQDPARMEVELRRIHRESGANFVYVTHDQREVLALSDRVVVFNEGRVDQVGTPDEVYHQPASPFAVRFVGDANVLPVTSRASMASRRRSHSPGRP